MEPNGAVASGMTIFGVASVLVNACRQLRDAPKDREEILEDINRAGQVNRAFD